MRKIIMAICVLTSAALCGINSVHAGKPTALSFMSGYQAEQGRNARQRHNLSKLLKPELYNSHQRIEKDIYKDYSLGFNTFKDLSREKNTEPFIDVVPEANGWATRLLRWFGCH